MAIRVEKDPMGMGGRAWYVAAPADIAKLPPTAAALVPPRVAEIFADAPRALARMAAEAPLAGMRRWLASLAATRCELEVYATPHFGREARLRFHVTEAWAPSFRAVPGKPKVACPEILRQVHAVTGHVDTQYGCSGTLVALDAVRTLGDLIEEQRIMDFESLAEIVDARPELRASIGIYEADGDWLCVAPDGRTFWAGGEWVDEPVVERARGVAAELDRYFDALTAQRSFGPDA